MTAVTVLFWSLLAATFSISLAALALSARRLSTWAVRKRLAHVESQLADCMSLLESNQKQVRKLLAKMTMRERRKKESSSQNGSMPNADTDPEAWKKWASLPPHMRK